MCRQHKLKIFSSLEIGHWLFGKGEINSFIGPRIPAYRIMIVTRIYTYQLHSMNHNGHSYIMDSLNLELKLMLIFIIRDNLLLDYRNRYIIEFQLVFIFL